MPDSQGSTPAGQPLFAAGTDEQKALSCRVVGIGAGAGGLEAIQHLFAAMPAHLNLAFVICRQTHADITDHLGALLRHETTMPIHQVEHGTRLEGNAIYLMPPRARMVLVKGRLVQFDDDDADLQVAPLDLLFHGLAASQGSEAMALLLSGDGDDGLRGAVSVRRAGGLVLVQDPESAPFSERLNAVVDAGLASAHASPEAMPGLIGRFVETGEIETETAMTETAEETALGGIFHLLATRFGLDLEAYRKTMVARRIRRRAGLSKAEDLHAYLARLAADEREVDMLHDDLMIGVTAFFRDPEAFSMLAAKVVPALVDASAQGRPIRVWVPACASGEEAYSLAMLIADHLRELGRAQPIEIVATDRCGRSLKEARLARYHGDQLLNLPADLVDRYMEPAGEQLAVSAEIRDLVTFSHHDLVQEPPMTDMGLVSCRNLLIYLAPEARRKALSACRQALDPGGFLFLGPSEMAGSSTEGLSVIDRRWRIYQKTMARPESQALKHLPKIYRERPAETIQPPEDIKPVPYRPLLSPDHDHPGLFDGMMEQNQQMLESTIDTLLASNDALRRRNRDLRMDNQRLSAANSALEDIATLVAHDLKAPLLAVDHLARRLEDSLQVSPGQESAESDLRHMQLRLVSLHRLIDDLLIYARQDADNQRGIEQVELGGLIREALVLIGLPPGFRLEVRPPALTVRTRRIPLACILRNLLGNVIEHHGRSKGQIRITIQESEDALDIRIVDDGEGMKDRPEGLGLAIVRQLLAGEGSHLSLTPREGGQGTEARLTWPIDSS